MTAPLLTLVPGDHVRPAWHQVRDRIASLAAATNEPWIAEDVYHELLTGAAHLWATQFFEGFVVLSIMTAPYTRDLHVWIACNDTVARAHEFWPQLREIARAHSCTRLMFESPRRWERAVPGLTVRHVYSETI